MNKLLHSSFPLFKGKAGFGVRETGSLAVL